MFRRIGKNFKLVLYSTFLWGIFAHGMMIFNKFSFHDDAGLFGIGGTYSSGRWMLGILGEGSRKLFGSDYYSLPLFNGIVSILLIAISMALLADLFELQKKWVLIALSGIMVTFPMVTSTFGYMFTAPYYFLGIFMGVAGVYLSCKCRVWYGYVAGLILMACGVGVYQANIPVFVSAILIYAIKVTADEKKAIWKSFFQTAVKSICSCVGFMVFYFIFNKIALGVTGSHLSDYQGINNMGVTSVSGYLHRIVTAYKEFFWPTDGTSANMYPFSSDLVYKIILLFAAVVTVLLLKECWKREKMLVLQIAVFLVFIPLACNFIYVMCDPVQVDSIMTYGEVMVFVYIAWIMEQCTETVKLQRLIGKAAFCFLLLLNVMFCRFSNTCYLKAELMFRQAVSYLTVLTAQIKSTEGFTTETPVVYINEYGKYDYTTANVPEMKEIKLIPYEHSSILNNYAWKTTMKMWCDFDPEQGDASEFENLPEVTEMPSYPNAGSIRMIDGTLVVKF